MQRKLFRYYGAKTHLIEDINKVIAPLIHNKKITTFVDVFGGSGLVLLNLPLEWKLNKVYNDIDLRLYNLLNDLKDEDKRNKLFDNLFWTLGSRKLLNDFKNKENNNSFEFLYRIFYSFNADMSVYSISISAIKNPYNVQFNTLKRNWSYIKEWNIECLDFEELIQKYDSKTTFFYLDPPYVNSGKTYEHNFNSIDFLRLKTNLDNLKGFYLMNEAERDFDKIINVYKFGKPNFTKQYTNHCMNSRVCKDNRTYRLEGFWYNF